jgi:hypothetical protein
LLSAKLEGRAIEDLSGVFSVSGAIPRGALGMGLMEKLLEDAPEAPEPTLKPEQRITHTLRVELAHPADSERCFTLEGELRTGWYHFQNGGSPSYHYYSASKKDFGKELQFLADALLLACSVDGQTKPNPPLSPAQFRARAEAHFKGNESYSLTLPLPDQARALLAELLPLLEAAQSVALPLWPKSIEAMCKKATPTAMASPSAVSGP